MSLTLDKGRGFLPGRLKGSAPRDEEPQGLEGALAAAGGGAVRSCCAGVWGSLM